MNSSTRSSRFGTGAPVRVPLGYEEHAGDKQFATTLARGIELLRCFTPDEPQLGNRELAARTGLPRSTVSRLTYTLTLLGYLRHSPRLGGYQLGSALIATAYPLLASIGLRQLARPHMNALVDATGGSVSMGVRDRLNIVIVETSRGRRRAATPAWVADTGLSLPICGSAIGHAYLAGVDPDTREALFNEIRVKTPAAWARFGALATSAIRDYVRQGFCVIDGDLVPSVQAVGVPFGRTIDGEFIVFNCTFQASGRDAGWLRGEIGPALASMVRALRGAPAIEQARS